MAIGGNAGSGKKSFTNLNYYLYPAYQAYEYYLQELEVYNAANDPNLKAPTMSIKFIYIDLTESLEALKLKWFCTLFYIKYKFVIDVPSILNEDNTEIGPGKFLEYMGEIDGNFASYFDDFLDKTTYLHNKKLSSNEIEVILEKQIESKKDKRRVVVIVNNPDNLRVEDNMPRAKHNQIVNLGDVLKHYSIKHSFTCILCLGSSEVLRSNKPLKPHNSQLGHFNTVVDVGIICYDPFSERDFDYLRYEIRRFIQGRNNRFRSATVIRNNCGPHNVHMPCHFIGENGIYLDDKIPSLEDTDQMDEYFTELGS